MVRFDHIAVSAQSLAEGAAAMAERLGQPLRPGGQHPAMGTHNMLARFGDGEYFELVAIDPKAVPPGRPRWFSLDHFDGSPRLTNWICRCDDLDAALALAPEGAGVPMALTRGDLSWRMAVPEDGKLPFDGLFPALIEWSGGNHPADLIPDTGLRLQHLTLTHPDAPALRAALTPLLDLSERIRVEQGDTPGLSAVIDTPNGPVTL